MYLELSAMHLLELHRALEADRRRETRESVRRALLTAPTDMPRRSGEIGAIALGDRASRRGDPSTDVGRA
jgi:hypothetical protein